MFAGDRCNKRINSLLQFDRDQIFSVSGAVDRVDVIVGIGMAHVPGISRRITCLVPRLRRSDDRDRCPSPSGLGLRLAVGPTGLGETRRSDFRLSFRRVTMKQSRLPLHPSRLLLLGPHHGGRISPDSTERREQRPQQRSRQAQPGCNRERERIGRPHAGKQAFEQSCCKVRKRQPRQ
jgi:hypothetical protein